MRMVVLSIGFSLASTVATAAGFDGSYSGTRKTTQKEGATQYCGTSNAVQFKVSGSQITVGRSGNNSGTIDSNGNFSIVYLFGADRDTMTMRGSIKGNALTGTWQGQGRQATCGGPISARKG